MKKRAWRWLIVPMLLFSLILIACGKNIGGVFPDDWYELTSSMNGGYISRPFELDNSAELTVSVTTKEGGLQLGIKNTETKEFIYEIRDFDNVTNMFLLPAGSYELVWNCDNHTGSFSVKKENKQ